VFSLEAINLLSSEKQVVKNNTVRFLETPKKKAR
jgi:hypothetical protein